MVQFEIGVRQYIVYDKERKETIRHKLDGFDRRTIISMKIGLN